MAKYGSSSAGFLLVGGDNVLGVTTLLADSQGASTAATQSLGDAWPESLPTGVRNATVDASGLYDDAAGSINDAHAANVGTSQVVCWNLSGDTTGNAFHGVEGAYTASYVRGTSVGELHTAKGVYDVSGKLDTDGVILHTLSAETANYNTDTSGEQDNGASSSAGGAGYVQCTALTLGGYTSVTHTVRHSADDITYTTLLSFTTITASSTAERVAVSGTVNRYISCSGTFVGSGSGPSVTSFIGFKRDA